MLCTSYNSNEMNTANMISLCAGCPREKGHLRLHDLTTPRAPRSPPLQTLWESMWRTKRRGFLQPRANTRWQWPWLKVRHRSVPRSLETQKPPSAHPALQTQFACRFQVGRKLLPGRRVDNALGTRSGSLLLLLLTPHSSSCCFCFQKSPPAVSVWEKHKVKMADSMAILVEEAFKGIQMSSCLFHLLVTGLWHVCLLLCSLAGVLSWCG